VWLRTVPADVAVEGEPGGLMDPEDYFNLGKVENPRFWSWLGGKPDFRAAMVGDLGSGHGSLSVEIAEDGASRVIGFDVNTNLVEFANHHLRAHYPHLVGVVDFRSQDLRESNASGFDYFVSKDTFEHVTDLAGLLAAMRGKLKPGGMLYAAFGPLWHAPFGGHFRAEMPFPWAHLILNERYLVRRLRRAYRPGGETAATFRDLGLNKLSFADYVRIFTESEMRVRLLTVNPGRNFAARVGSALRLIPPLQEYFTNSLACILENPLGP
jgi:SAM-dependent methyltransferase